MSIISPDTIRVIAENCGISIAKVSDEVAQVVIQEVEFKMRLIIQESAKYMKHSKHEVLSVENVNFALRSLDFSEVFGHTGRKNVDLRFVGLPGFPSDMFKVEDKILNITDITTEALPLCPRDCSLDFHWLAIDGTQPSVPQNPVFENKLEKKRKATDSQVRFDPAVVEVDVSGQKKAPLVTKEVNNNNNNNNNHINNNNNNINNNNKISSTKVPADQILIRGERQHELSKDHQLYLEKIEETILAMSKIYPKLSFERLRRSHRVDHDRLSEFCLSHQIHLFSDYLFNDKINFIDQKEEIFAAAIHSLQHDAVASLLPYLIQFLCEWYPKCLDTVLMLTSLTHVVTALFSNPYLEIQQYIHQLIPLIATCVIRPSLGNPQRMENHWILRDFASRLLVCIIFKFGNPENQIENRMTKTFVTYLQNSTYSFGSYYGVLRALSLMGHHYIEFLIIPSIMSLHTRAVNSINANLCNLKTLEETQLFLNLLIEIVGNYFREMVYYFQILKTLPLVRRELPEEYNISDILSSLDKKTKTKTNTTPKTKKNEKPKVRKAICHFIPYESKMLKNNFLKKKKIHSKEALQSEQLLSNQYKVATQHFGESFIPFFAEFIPEMNLFY
jgi:transcription initiation factor TFIID subunit 6